MVKLVVVVSVENTDEQIDVFSWKERLTLWLLKLGTQEQSNRKFLKTRNCRQFEFAIKVVLTIVRLREAIVDDAFEHYRGKNDFQIRHRATISPDYKADECENK